MNSKERAEFDQATAECAESFPTHWGAFFKNLLAQGFERNEAMHLLTLYVERTLPWPPPAPEPE